MDSRESESDECCDNEAFSTPGQDDQVHARIQWLEEAMPALANTSILKGCDWDCLEEVRESVAEASFARSFEEGDVVWNAGEPNCSLFVLLEGSLALMTRSGTHIGYLSAGATVGEAECMGLLPTRGSTACAMCTCRVFVLTEEALRCMLITPAQASLKSIFDQVVANRLKQVETGLPLSGLTLGAKAEDMTVRAVALQADRLHLRSGEHLPLISDDHPSGPQLGVLLRGRAVIEMPPDKRPLLTLASGSLIYEGLIAEYGAQLRALADCEVYRIPRIDLVAAAHSTERVADWLYRLKLIELEAHSTMRSRLVNARGVANGKWHPADEAIQMWKQQRQVRVRRAAHLRHERNASEVTSKLPLLPITSDEGAPGATEHRSWPKPANERMQVHRGTPALRLPKVKDWAKHIYRVRSEPQLQAMLRHLPPERPVAFVPETAPLVHATPARSKPPSTRNCPVRL